VAGSRKGREYQDMSDNQPNETSETDIEAPGCPVRADKAGGQVDGIGQNKASAEAKRDTDRLSKHTTPEEMDYVIRIVAESLRTFPKPTTARSALAMVSLMDKLAKLREARAALPVLVDPKDDKPTAGDVAKAMKGL